MKRTILAVVLAVAAAGCFDNRAKPTEVPTVKSLAELAATNRTVIGRVLVRGTKEKMTAETFANLPSLRTLDLSETGLKDLPAGVTVLTNLKDLYLARNAFVFFPKDLSTLANLTYLNLDGNAITKLPTAATQLPLALRWLRLNGNPIADVPPAFAQLKELRRFYLRNAKLSAVPEVAKEWALLEDLVLDGNAGIREVPAWLTAMPNLKGVSFAGCGITKLPEDLTGWKKLAQLNLTGCPLSTEETKRVRAALPDVAIVF